MKSLRISFSDVSYLCGKVAYLHDGEDIGSGAFDINKKAELRILLPRSLGVVSVFAKIYNESLTNFVKICCQKSGFNLKNDTYTLRIEDKNIGLYFVSFEILTVSGTVYGMKGKGRALILCEKECGNHFQYSVADTSGFASDDFRGGIIYHIFVDRFNKGGKVPKRDDAILVDDWNAIPEYPEYPGAHLENNTFFGGTLYGIIEKLDYIKSLGTTLIYLSPIFKAYSNHKYDTSDYMTVDEMFGGEQALKLLIKEAKKRGIGIILDGVFNHTGSDSIYFNKNGKYKTLGAYQSKNSPYYSWYDFQNHPNKYTCWWGIEILPRINPDVKACGEYIAGDGGVIEKYAKMGIAGFRLDVADELSDDFIAKIKSKLREINSETLLYGEVWEDASNKIAYDKRKKYFLGAELDGVMNYPLRTGIIDFLKNKDKSALEYHFLDVMFNAPTKVQHMQMNILGTHDTERIITILAGIDVSEKSNDEISLLSLSDEQLKKGIGLLKMAYTVLATVPGIPAVFYGDEVGLQGYKDPFNRRTYPWESPIVELRDFYQKIGRIRTDSDAYKNGKFTLLYMDSEILVFSRDDGTDMFITVINNSESDILLKLSSMAKGVISESEGNRIRVRKQSSEIIKVKHKTQILNL
ncbi:MAG: glycoside hydrolase family 13 protein [Clostridia bacterium]|nr:glycoside hydrolase family 13 protein [Clostridia bacterium]